MHNGTTDPTRSGSWIESMQCYHLEQTMCNIAIMIKNAKTVFGSVVSLYFYQRVYTENKNNHRRRIGVYIFGTVYARIYAHMLRAHNTGIRNEYTHRRAYLSMHENLNSVNSHRRPKQISCGSMNSIEIAREYATLLHAKCIAANALKPIRIGCCC